MFHVNSTVSFCMHIGYPNNASVNIVNVGVHDLER